MEYTQPDKCIKVHIPIHREYALLQQMMWSISNRRPSIQMQCFSTATLRYETANTVHKPTATFHNSIPHGLIHILHNANMFFHRMYPLGTVYALP